MKGRWWLAATVGTAACTSGPQPLTIDVGSPPLFIAYRDGDGAWVENPPAMTQPDGSSRYRLAAEHPYEVIVVRPNQNNGFDVEELFAMPGENDELLRWSSRVTAAWPTSPSPTTHVDGQVLQSGVIDINGSPGIQSGSGAWSYHADVSGDVIDLVASGGGRVVARIGQTVVPGQPVVEPAIDLDADGVSLETATFDVTGLVGDELVTTSAMLVTANGCSGFLYASQSLDPLTVAVMPPGVLGKPSIQEVILDARAPTTFVDADVNLAAGSFALDLPARLTAITYDDATTSASWSALPSFAELRFDYLDATHLLGVTATRGWLDAMGATAIGFDASPPSFAAEWSAAVPATGHVFSVTDVQADRSLSTGVFDPPEPLAAAAR